MKARQHKKMLKAFLARQKVTNLLETRKDWVLRKTVMGEFIDHSREYVRIHMIIQKARNTRRIRISSFLIKQKNIGIKELAYIDIGKVKK